MIYRCDGAGWNNFRGERGGRDKRRISWNRNRHRGSNRALKLSTYEAFTNSSGNLFQQGAGNFEGKKHWFNESATSALSVLIGGAPPPNN